MNNPNIGTLLKKAKSLPLTPGVYIMKNKSGGVIYIGKAKAMRNRVTQYFSLQGGLPRAAGNPVNGAYVRKVTEMVENVSDFDYILTDSEFEALVLECSLIKQHTPKYNILLKDDKGYSFIKVTQDGWPNFYAVKKKENDGCRYIGPYVSSWSVTNSVEEAKKIFRIPTCNKVFPRDCGKGRPCLNFFIGQCSAPCAGKITEQAYRENVEAALDFFRNGSKKTVEELTAKMLEASENLAFEKAAKYRDSINAIKKIGEKQKVVSGSVKEQDVFAVVTAGGTDDTTKACFSVFRFSDSRLYDSEYFIVDLSEDLPIARHELIRDYYSMRSNVPPRISLDGTMESDGLIAEWLSSVAGRKVTVAYPVKGEQHALIEMCRSNAAQKLGQIMGKSGRSTAALDELGTVLGLKTPPQYIESYDISHTAGSDNVAGMVVFKDGRPYKKAYKRFAIKGFSGQDDYASMAEVLSRRFERYFEEKDSGEGFGKLPDLILLDGGQGQVHAVESVLRRYDLDIPLFGMVKDNRHRTRAIAGDGGEISLTSKRSAFTLVSEIQEEVHRFAISYHRQKHGKAGLTSSLTSIEGIGKTRAAALLKKFRTLKAISNATVEELAAVDGMNIAAAQAVKDAFSDNG